MSECIKWESVIPNFREGDIITPFESQFKQQKKDDFIIDGGNTDYGLLEKCASIRRKDSQKEGIYNQHGEQILPEDFDKCKVIIHNSGDFGLVSIMVQNEGLCGLYNENGELIVPVKYISISVRDTFIVVKDQNNLYGAYLYDGKQVIDCEYDDIEVEGSLDEGYSNAIISQKGLYGVKLETGNEIIPVKFDYITRDSGSGFIVYDKTSQPTTLKGWYSRDGKSNIPCLFKSFKFQYKEIIAETPDELKGIYSYDGKEIVPPKFKSINFIGNYIVGLIEDNDLSVYDFNGTCLFCTTE